MKELHSTSIYQTTNIQEELEYKGAWLLYIEACQNLSSNAFSESICHIIQNTFKSCFATPFQLATITTWQMKEEAYKQIHPRVNNLSPSTILAVLIVELHANPLLTILWVWSHEIWGVWCRGNLKTANSHKAAVGGSMSLLFSSVHLWEWKFLSIILLKIKKWVKIPINYSTGD